MLAMVQYLFLCVCVFSSYATSLVAVHLFREKAREMGLHCTARTHVAAAGAAGMMRWS